MRGLHFGEGFRIGVFWRDIGNVIRKSDHGKEAFRFPRIDDRWKSSMEVVAGGYAEGGVLRSV